MGRDYKSVRRTTPAKKKRRTRSKTAARRRAHKRTPGWLWMLGGLGIGLGIAVGAYFYGQIASPTTVATTKVAPTKPEAVKPAPKKPARPTPVEQDTASHFDFYTLLPTMEVVIPDSMIEEANKALPHHEKDLAYVLQTGSFRNAADADTMKAELALLGIEAVVETVVINDKETWHRVRLGPFPSMSALKPDRRQLKKNNIDFILLKVKL